MLSMIDHVSWQYSGKLTALTEQPTCVLLGCSQCHRMIHRLTQFNATIDICHPLSPKSVICIFSLHFLAKRLIEYRSASSRPTSKCSSRWTLKQKKEAKTCPVTVCGAKQKFAILKSCMSSRSHQGLLHCAGRVRFANMALT